VLVAADVVVVGGGVIGCACAHALASRGARVVLVERSELAAGASGRNHGLLLSLPDPALAALGDRSTAAYDELADDTPVDIRLDREAVGFLIVAGEAEGEREAGRVEAEAVAAVGVGVDHLDGDGAREVEPALGPEVAEAWLLHDGRRLDPAALTVSLALLARDRGAEVRRHVTARSLIVNGDRVRGVVTDEGEVAAEAVVVAAGPWTPSFLRPVGVEVAVEGARGWLVHLGEPPVVPRVLLEGAGWHVLAGEEAAPLTRAAHLDEGFPAPDVGTLLHPTPDRTVLAGGSRQAVVAPEPEDPGVPREILRHATRWIPGLAEARVLGAWWGIRPMSPDGLPLIGPVRDGLHVATGHGPYGVMLAAGTGELAASLVLREEPFTDPKPFDPLRFG
jgi:glycine/D-amino acid oxidase-like deaminating enzyme